MNVFIDDELPDYIMVMVANKKSEANMAKDLHLFLGDKTNKFSQWYFRFKIFLLIGYKKLLKGYFQEIIVNYENVLIFM